GVFEVLQVVGGPHPVRTPACDDDRLLALNGAVESGGHGSVGAVEQVDVQTVNLEGAVTCGHQSGTGIDADDFAVEQLSVLVDLGDSIDLDVGGNGPTDVGAFEVRPEVGELVAVLVPIGLVRRGQPGGHDRIEVALRHTRPHRTGVDRGEVDVVAELVHQNCGDHVGRRDLGIPEHVSELN